MLVPLLALSATQYRILDLGLPEGAEEVRAVAINNRGEVLVSSPVRETGMDAKGERTFQNGQGYLWRTGRYLDFGDPKPSKFLDPPQTVPMALNDFSVAVGWEGTGSAVFMSGLADINPFIWRGKTMEDLDAGWSSTPQSINNLGDIAGDGNHRAFARIKSKTRWFPVMSHFKPSDPSGEMGDVNQAEAVGINDRRQILMNSTYGTRRTLSGLSTRPFLIDGKEARATPRPLPLPQGYLQSRGLALNQRGTVLAIAINPAGTRSLPYLLRDRRLIRLPFAGAMNNRDEVVGGSPLAVWRNGRTVPLPTFPGWTLQTATGINDKGAICGTGLHEGKVRAYVLTPV